MLFKANNNNVKNSRMKYSNVLRQLNNQLQMEMEMENGGKEKKKTKYTEKINP